MSADPAPGAGGPTHRVAADGSRDYQTINDALAAAEDGDTILVAPGTYTEYLLIDKDITVAGDGPREEIVVEFPEGGPVQVFEDDDEGPYSVSFPVVLQGSDAILRGFTIRVPPEGVGVQVDGGGPELVDLSVVAHPDAQASGDISDIEVMALTFVNRIQPGPAGQFLDRHPVQRRLVADDRGQHSHRWPHGAGWPWRGRRAREYVPRWGQFPPRASNSRASSWTTI